MEEWFAFLFWLHMVSLALGAVPTAAMVVMLPFHASATNETRPVLDALGQRFGMLGGLGLLGAVVTGVLMFVARDYQIGAMPFWFWVKMVLVVLLVVAIVLAHRMKNRVDAGQAPASSLRPHAYAIAAIFALILAAAVASFG